MHPHTILSSIALFVGMFQLIFRWQWSLHMENWLDRLAIRVWSFSTFLTAALVAYAMWETRGYPVDKWYFCACLVVFAKFGASVVSIFALRHRIESDVPL